MTVAELKKELECYDDDMEVVFEFNDEIYVDSWTEDRWGNKKVSIDANLKPTFMSECRGDMQIVLGVIKDS